MAPCPGIPQSEAKIREADRLECEAWNTFIWAGGPAMRSPGEPQAEPAGRHQGCRTRDRQGAGTEKAAPGAGRLRREAIADRSPVGSEQKTTHRHTRCYFGG
jgi:hypothetical protein